MFIYIYVECIYLTPFSDTRTMLMNKGLAGYQIN